MKNSRFVPFALVAALVAAVSATVFAHDGDPKLLDRQPMYPGTGWRNAQLILTGPISGGRFAGTGGAMAFSHPNLVFPRSNVTLLSWLTLGEFGVPSGGNGNSCFGYTSPSGREYAIMGLSTGTAFVEVTHPGNPVIVGQIAGPQSLWRDMRVFSHYCYSVSEGGGGIQVTDLGQIDNGVVTLVNSVTTGGVLSTHTVALNTDSGTLYRAGGSSTSGLRIYDLNADPSLPNYVGTWSDRYVHEAQIVTYPTGGPGGGPRELAICCGGLNTGYTDTGINIVDVTNHASPVSLLHIVYGQPGYSHQAWLSPDRMFLYHDDEIDGRPFTRVFDASNINVPAPQLPYIGEFQNGTSVDHNLYTKGTLIFESNYRGGLHVFDRAADPIHPTQIAFFDTWPEDDNANYNGLWNNYPYFASGTVVGSDIEKGLFVWWVGTPQIAFSFPQGLPATINPAGQTVLVQVSATPAGVIVPGTLKLSYDAGAGFTMTDLVPLGGSSYAAVFPPIACGSNVSFYLSGQGTNGVVWSYPETAPVDLANVIVAAAENVVVNDNFETDNGWTSPFTGDTATSGLWLRAAPVGTIAQPSLDHSSTGTLCWVTGNSVLGNPPDAADVDGGRTTLLSPAYDLSAMSVPVIGYWRWYSNDQGGAPHTDVFTVDVSNDNGTTWTNVETVGPNGVQTSGGWFNHAFRVADFVAPTAQVRVRFVASDLGVDSTVEAALDDVQVFDALCRGTASFCSGDGSASACPCGNAGASGTGCANSTGQGAGLATSGAASVGGDTLALNSSGMPSGTSVLFFQGTQADNGGLGSAFGDGLRCVAGNIVRLGTKTAPSGSASFPSAGDPTISAQGGVTAGATRYYQGWYRNVAAFCQPETFNLTNGVSVIWAP
jgi:choice-of-anchor B domain-containing protein